MVLGCAGGNKQLATKRAPLTHQPRLNHPHLCDHLAQQLVLEALGRHEEIEERYPDRDLCREVGVAQLGGHDQPEVLVVGHDGVAEADGLAAAVLERGAQQDGLQRGIQGAFAQVLQQRLCVHHMRWCPAGGGAGRQGTHGRRSTGCEAFACIQIRRLFSQRMFM